MTTTFETTLRDLIRHIVTEHHGYLRRNLPVIADGVSARGDVELAAAFGRLRQELMLHLTKEESVLFPAIDRLESAQASGEPLPKAYFGSMRLPVQILEEEHHIADVALARIRELTDGFTVPRGELGAALKALDADLHEHMRLENEVLFPRVMDLESRV